MSNYKQNGGFLGDVEPGKRVKNVVNRLQSGTSSRPDMSQASTMIPDEPGPSALGRTTVVGQLRRDRDMPVLRDEVPELLD